MIQDELYTLRISLQEANQRADNAERLVKQLQAGLCGTTGELQPSCRYLLVAMANDLKNKRIKRDGR